MTEQHTLNELYRIEAQLQKLNGELDRLMDVLRSAQYLADAINTENLMTRPNVTHNISSGGLFGEAYVNLMAALRAYQFPNGDGR
jgi:hypothetical protein